MNIPLSPLGYGCYALGGAYGNNIETSRATKLLELAYNLGIRFFDTADQYGTEEILGRAVRPFRNQITIATKVGSDSSGKGTLTRSHILSSCESSLRRLKTDYIDLYQVHYDDVHTPVSDVVETMEILKSQGKIRAYGVGHLPLSKTRDYLELGSPQTVLAEMNAAAQNRYRELLPLQETYDFGIVAFSVTGRGLLTGCIPPSPHFSQSDIRRIDPFFRKSKLASGLRIMDKLAKVGNPIQATPAQTAIAWVLKQPGVASALTGPTDPAHLRENCAALEVSLDPAMQEEINAFIHQEEAELKEKLLQEFRVIVNTPNLDQPAQSLIYVLEHSIEAELIPYEAGVELFTALLQDPDPMLLERCQSRIRKLLEPALASRQGPRQ